MLTKSLIDGITNAGEKLAPALGLSPVGSWLTGLVVERNQISRANPTRGNAKKVIDALRGGKKTTAQLEDETGLSTEQVREVFRRHRGRAIISEPVRYSLAPTNSDIA